MFAIIAGVIFVGFVVFAVKERDGLIAMFGLMAAVIGGLLTALIIDAPVAWVQRDRVDFEYSLGALNDGQEVKGSFFLGSGTIDSVPSFMYYVQEGDGYVLRDWSASSSKVVETEGDPKVVYNCYDYSDVWLPFRWAPQMLEDGSVYDCRSAFVTFYVPPGSVKQTYNLDAK